MYVCRFVRALHVLPYSRISILQEPASAKPFRRARTLSLVLSPLRRLARAFACFAVSTLGDTHPCRIEAYTPFHNPEAARGKCMCVCVVVPRVCERCAACMAVPASPSPIQTSFLPLLSSTLRLPLFSSQPRFPWYVSGCGGGVAHQHARTLPSLTPASTAQSMACKLNTTHIMSLLPPPYTLSV